MYMKPITATEFLKNALTELVALFPKIRVRYEFDAKADVHCIEVTPNHVHQFDDNFKTWESNFILTFINLYKDQNLYFFSDDAIIGITKPTFELTGKQYTYEVTS